MNSISDAAETRMWDATSKLSAAVREVRCQALNKENVNSKLISTASSDMAVGRDLIVGHPAGPDVT